MSCSRIKVKHLHSRFALQPSAWSIRLSLSFCLSRWYSARDEKRQMRSCFLVGFSSRKRMCVAALSLSFYSREAEPGGDRLLHSLHRLGWFSGATAADCPPIRKRRCLLLQFWNIPPRLRRALERCPPVPPLLPPPLPPLPPSPFPFVLPSSFP